MSTPQPIEEFEEEIDTNAPYHYDANDEDYPEAHLKKTEGKVDDGDDDVAVFSNEPMNKFQVALASAGMLFGFVVLFIEMGGDRKINQTLSIAIWMATLWLTDVIPNVVTAFLPLFLFPYFGIVSAADVAMQYVDNLNWLFISGFLLSLCLERWNLHRRISLKILTWCGTKPRPLLFGIMGATFFLSMFISNTATALMMVTNGVSICQSLEANLPPQYRSESKRFAIAVLLGIGYAANVGGMSSLIGTGPNLALARQISILFPEAPEMTFADWWGFGLPIGLFIFFTIWAYLSFMFLRNFKGTDSIEKDLFRQQYAALGPWTYEQATVAISFGLLAFLWVFRADLEFSALVIKGWRNIFPEPLYITDTTIGMTVAFFLMICPARADKLPEESLREYMKQDRNADPDSVQSKSYWTTLLDWNTANKMPYNIIFLLGGGFALAGGFVESGLSEYLGDQLAALDVSLTAILYVMIFLIIWLTELTSNTSTSNIMIPIAGSLAVATGVSPYTFMIPATMACSCAFFLPIATPPNMVVYATGRLPLQEMNKAGVFLNLLCSAILLAAPFTIIPMITGVKAREFPAWAYPADEEDGAGDTTGGCRS